MHASVDVAAVTGQNHIYSKEVSPILTTMRIKENFTSRPLTERALGSLLLVLASKKFHGQSGVQHLQVMYS